MCIYSEVCKCIYKYCLGLEGIFILVFAILGFGRLCYTYWHYISGAKLDPKVFKEITFLSLPRQTVECFKYVLALKIWNVFQFMSTFIPESGPVQHPFAKVLSHASWGRTVCLNPLTQAVELNPRINAWTIRTATLFWSDPLCINLNSAPCLITRFLVFCQSFSGFFFCSWISGWFA